MQDNEKRLKEILSKKVEDVTQEELGFVFENMNWGKIVDEVFTEMNNEITEENPNN